MLHKATVVIFIKTKLMEEAMFIKICGVKSKTDFSYAVEAGATAVGCIVGAEWECPDELSLQEALDLFEYFFPCDACKVLVTHKKDFDTLSLYLNLLDCDAVQFHGNPPLEVVKELRYIHRDKFFIGVVYGNDPEVREKVRGLVNSNLFNAILVDTKTETKVRGTGLTHDWTITASLVNEFPDVRFILAGGLNPYNVSSAINTVRPWGVDVNSGVKGNTGYKDKNLVKTFVRNSKLWLSRYQSSKKYREIEHEGGCSRSSTY